MNSSRTADVNHLSTPVHVQNSLPRRGTAAWLLALSTLGIIYGSLYPFQMLLEYIDLQTALHILFSDWHNELGAPNIFANIVLFIPYGLFGLLIFAPKIRFSHCVLVFVSGAFVAAVLQVAQLWLAARSPTMVDALINMTGVAAGMLCARISQLQTAILGLNSRNEEIIAIPFLLMLCWLAYHWFPYVPTVDVIAIRDGLRPLYLEPELRPLNLFHNLVGWLVFAALWQQCGYRVGFLWLLIPLAVLAKAGIASNAIYPHNILAAVLATPVWLTIQRLSAKPMIPLLILLTLTLWVQGLRPFELAPSGFRWIPFSGFLSGNMMINTINLLEKLFLYGSLVWLALNITHSRTTALLFPVITIAAIEVMQTQIVGRVAEITDPVLCVVIWFLAIRAGRRATQTND